MSREIKFRYVWKLETSAAIGIYTLDEIEKGLPVAPKADRKPWMLESRDEFTGLKDKNGVEIYEGDIVSLNAVDQVESSDIYFAVKWCSENHQWIIYHNDVEFYNLADFDFWKIGNIHQNPELLKQ